MKMMNTKTIDGYTITPGEQYWCLKNLGSDSGRITRNSVPKDILRNLFVARIIVDKILVNQQPCLICYHVDYSFHNYYQSDFEVVTPKQAGATLFKYHDNMMAYMKVHLYPYLTRRQTQAWNGARHDYITEYSNMGIFEMTDEQIQDDPKIMDAQDRMDFYQEFFSQACKYSDPNIGLGMVYSADRMSRQFLQHGGGK